MALTGAPIPALLQRRAELQPDDSAYTFIDYDRDPDGFAETLTWSQVLQRSGALAEELARCGSPGDRAAILAPQGLEYIVAFYGAIQAGFIAVPLSVPQYGVHDQRVASALRDSQPAVILTTSAAVGDVQKYAAARDGHTAPIMIELDLLDLDSPSPSGEWRAGRGFPSDEDAPAYLQYTSGSTRSPAGVIITHKNLTTNMKGSMTSFFGESGMSTPGINWVSWLPYYHDLGLMFGIAGPMLDGRHGVSLSPQSFLQRPARWMQLLARSGECWSGGPNFAFDLAARKTSDEHMAGLNLGNVVALSNGGERIHVPTALRFLERFAPFDLSPNAIVPSYGLAESTLYVATPRIGLPPNIARFDSVQLAAGRAQPCADGATYSELIGYGPPNPATVRIVDPQTMRECEPGAVGEIWTHGDSVGCGYWRHPEQTARTFGAKISDPTPGTPEGPWLQTGDLGVVFGGELFIIGRIKDLLIVDGRNYYPDDIEATIRDITGGRVAAIAIANDVTEQLVAIAEVKKPGTCAEETMSGLRAVKREVTSAVSRTHGLRVADLVLVPSGSIPVTTSGKIRRSNCADLYHGDGFKRLDASA